MVWLLASRRADQFTPQRESLERPVSLATHAIAMLGNFESHVANEYLVNFRFVNPVKSNSDHSIEEKMNHAI